MTTLRSETPKGYVQLCMVLSTRGPHNEEQWCTTLDFILNISHSNFSHVFPRKWGPFHEIHSLICWCIWEAKFDFHVSFSSRCILHFIHFHWCLVHARWAENGMCFNFNFAVLL